MSATAAAMRETFAGIQTSRSLPAPSDVDTWEHLRLAVMRFDEPSKARRWAASLGLGICSDLQNAYTGNHAGWTVQIHGSAR